MKNMKFWRTALVATLVLTVMLSVTGGTIAWFTDTVESNSNIIKSGTLDIEMSWANGKDDPTAETTVWKDASEGAIFDYDKWEPGYVEVRHVKIENKGTLALKYELELEPTGEVSELADVMDVYYVDPAQQVTDRSLSGLAYQSTLSEFIALNGTGANSAAGHLAAGEEAHTVTIALKMQESAGNEYQGKAIGSNFKLVLRATQDTVEPDSFDEKYDAEAGMPGAQATAEEKRSLIAQIGSAADGATIYLDELDYGEIRINAGHGYNPLPKNLTLVGDPSTRMDFILTGQLDLEGWTFKNVTFKGDGKTREGLQLTESAASMKNVTIENCAFVDNAQFYIAGKSENVTVKDSTFYGIQAASEVSSILLVNANGVTITGCTFVDADYNAVQLKNTTGDIKFTNNIINDTDDRPLRFTNKSASYTISGNTINSNGDANGELMKISGTIAEENVGLSGNTWNGKADTEMTEGLNDKGEYVVQ